MLCAESPPTQPDRHAAKDVLLGRKAQTRLCFSIALYSGVTKLVDAGLQSWLRWGVCE
jgi:hypothetical protein